MKLHLSILVQEPDKRNPGKFLNLLRNSFDIDESLHFDYQSIITGIKNFFPGRQLYINFTIS